MNDNEIRIPAPDGVYLTDLPHEPEGFGELIELDASLVKLATERVTQLAEIIPHPGAEHGSRHQEVTVNVPGATSEDLRNWAGRIEVENPISYDGLGHKPTCGINVTDHPFMGVELTLAADGRPLLTLTLFGDRPNDEERKIMETENDGTAGL